MRTGLKRIAKTSLIAIGLLALVGILVVVEFYFGIAPLGESRSRPVIILPELSGRYPVGRRFFDWIDSARPDPFHKSAKRELVVSVWYPAQAAAANQTGAYLSGNRGLVTARFQSMMLRVRVQSFWSALVRNPLPKEVFSEIQTHAVENVAVSHEEPRLPVLLFLPGFGAMATEYTAILEDVASHGYVVVAITPTDFVPATVFDSGRTVYAPLWSPSLYNIRKNLSVWVQDMLFTLNEVSQANKNPQSPFFDRLDMTRVGAFGHSLGGVASAAACHFDSRIGAGLNLDGATQGDRSTWKFAQPFMLVQSGKRASRDGADEEFIKGLTLGYRVVIKGSTHHAFTDEAMLPLPQGRREALVGNVSGPRMVRMTSVLVSAFFDTFLLKKPAGLLQKVSSQFPEITIQSYSAGDSAK